MTREEDHLRRFDILIDLNYAARVAGFSGVHVGTVRWTQTEPLEKIERLRGQRMEYARGILAKQLPESRPDFPPAEGIDAEGLTPK